jgi:carboxyl-terminal processing protease
VAPFPEDFNISHFIFMSIPWFRRVASTTALIALSCSACGQQADFNEVGKQMAMMLQNSHFARLPFNAELSKRFLDDYLKDLDFQRLYFTQADVDGFTVKFGDQLHTQLLHSDSLPAATEIYKVFEKRVEQRVAQAELLLNGADFDFSKDESVMLSRKEAAWPKDEAQAAELWRTQIKEAVLAETLRRELLTKMAKEQGKADPGGDERSPKDKVWLRYKRFLKSVKDVDDEEIANYFLSAVARSYDPHTDYMSFREMSRFKDGMKNELVGIGALLQGEEDGATKIMGIVVGGPADREGTLKLNDRVVGVNTLNSGKADDMTDIMFMKIDKVVDYIRGKEGSTVALKVEPAGGAPGETKIVMIQRDKVEMKDEQAHGDVIEMLTDKGVKRRIGFLTLPSFYADFEEGKIKCSVDVERILNRFNTEKIEGLILDLRNNGGGSLEEVRRMTGFFVARGPVVQVKNTLGQVQVKESDAEKPIYTGPMAILTDKSSASASEILAGALQDFNRAVVIGESSTFGKGTVQQPMDIGRMLPLFAERNKAGFLKVTIQKFYRPSGSSTQMDGVVSNLVIPSLMDAMDVGEAYLDHPLPHDRIRPAADFKPLDINSLFIPRLKELSEERIKACEDFAYVAQDIVKAKERLKANKLSLNRESREQELKDSDVQQKLRNGERRTRFAKISEADKKNLKFFKVTLDEIEKNSELKAYDPANDSGAYMRKAKDATAELDETPKWPTGLDPVKRESLAVLADLIDLTDNAKLAGTLKSPAAVRE